MKNTIVIKIGSNSMLESDGKLNEVFLRRIVIVLKRLQTKGKLPILVLSGAVATGKADSPDLNTYSARAARGQFIITSLMHKIGEQEGVRLAQFLISSNDIIDRERYTSLQKTFYECLDLGIVPLINENDATAAINTHDFIDNDQVAIIVGVVAEAESIFLFTNVAGVFRTAPTVDVETEQAPIACIADVNKELMSMYIGKKSSTGRGGMESKLRAARIASFVGMTTYILNGKILEHALDIVDGEECRGTVCLPWPKPISLSEKGRWLIVSHTSSASIKIDNGAVEALRKRKSLLAVGVTKVYGEFSARDSVEVIDEANRPVAFGVSAISSTELCRMIAALERPFDAEVIHADNLILFPV